MDSISLYHNGSYAVTVSSVDKLYRWNTKDDPDGVHSWEIRGWDRGGNMGISPALLVRVSNWQGPPPGDRTPPLIVWQSPEPGSDVQGETDLKFQVMDDDSVASVAVLINGSEREEVALHQDDPISYTATWNTQPYRDGLYTVTIKSLDRTGNQSFPTYQFRVLNHPDPVPKVIWVPDDYQTIQGAIDARNNRDTVRVRRGIYRESLYLWDKNIWIESEKGPELTIIDVGNIGRGILVDAGQDTTVGIRGFTFTNSPLAGITVGHRSSPKVLNNICLTCASSFFSDNRSSANVTNNIFSATSEENLLLYIHTGAINNNIIIRTPANRYAFWNVSIYENPVQPDYNCVWDYDRLTNNPPIRLGPNNLIGVDPEFEEGSYRLKEGSPCIDAGDPNLLDPDGSRSDIGVYGGPFAYPPPE